MWVKICGNTRLEDCLVAAELGADAVGFVFAPGKRTVTAAHVATITARLPNVVEKIGVFTTHDAIQIASAVRAAGLTGIQLHSRYDPQLITALRLRPAHSRQVRLLQVVEWNLDRPLEQQQAEFAATLRQVEGDGLVDAVLVDACTAQASGGTGKVFAWKAAAAALQALRLPVIAAGGLRADNVGEAMAVLAPAGVDVSSGVEQAPGVKDAHQLRTFIANARMIQR